MSLINKMLQELDKREAQAAPGARPEAGRLIGEVKAVGAPARSSGHFWRTVALTVALMLGWVVWVLWQTSPRSVVTDRAHMPPRQANPSAPSPPPPPPAPARDVARAELRLAKEIAAPAAPATAARATPASMASAPRPAGPGVPEAPRSTARSLDAPLQVGSPPPTPAEGGPGRITKRDGTPAERAESEYRRALAYVDQGRVAEGLDGLRTVLAMDPAHDEARRTLVALLLEARRTGEAAERLQEGLSANPANTAFAALLARLAVERGDSAGALALMLKHAPHAQQDAEYRAFLGTLYQRVGRHAEAIGEYAFALRARPGQGAWWAGLGISQEAAGREEDAKDAYRRARASGNLNEELAAFVDGRLRQMR